MTRTNRRSVPALVAALLAGAWPAALGPVALAQDAPPPPADSPAPEPLPPPVEETPPLEEEPAEQEEPEELREAIVRLHTGQRITGRLVKQDDREIVLLVGNIRMTLAADQVDRIEVQPTVAEQYENMRRMIGPRDLQQRLLLAQWLLDKEKYDWALAEVDGVLDEDPASPDAQRLRRLVVSQIDLRARAGQPRPEPVQREKRPPKFQFPLLNAEQINLIKVYEVDLSDPPRMVIPREAIDRLLAENAGHELLPPTQEGRDALYRKPPAEVLDLMFRMNARGLYSMIQVQEQPKSMARFRDDVMVNWLGSSCATDRCHGGAEAGRLRLHNKKPNSDPTVYTNFLILDRFRMADERPLISFSEPARSPLLQLAIPREDSTSPHPPVFGAGGKDIWRPALESADDPRFSEAVRWIKSMYQPRPEYPIAYEPPGASLPRTDAAAAPQPR
jgi:hypothetical protein